MEGRTHGHRARMTTTSLVLVPVLILPAPPLPHRVQIQVKRCVPKQVVQDVDVAPLPPHQGEVCRTAILPCTPAPPPPLPAADLLRHTSRNDFLSSLSSLSLPLSLRQPWYTMREGRAHTMTNASRGRLLSPPVAGVLLLLKWGVGHLLYYYLHNSTYRCDNNFQAYCQNTLCFAKTFYVLGKP